MVARGGCNIYMSRKTGKDWSKPLIVDSVNSLEWDSHPCLSADGNTLFFVSSRPGGYGRYDIYVATRGKNGKFSRAKNAGPAINTEDDEIMPFLHANGSTLFFGSRGHAGMGGLDLYMANRAPLSGADFTKWDQPTNLGYPLNTSADESSIYISPDGQRAYYCVEDNENGYLVRSLIYEFGLGNQLNLQRRSYFAKGTVRDAVTKKPLGGHIELVDNATGQAVYTVDADPQTGQYLMALPEGSRYGLTVSAAGYLFQSRFFDFKDVAATGAVQQDFDLEPLKLGAKTVLNNVFFASGSADLLAESQSELNRVADLMKMNTKLKVEIGGHTDSVGTDEANLSLSKRRATNVRDFLLKAAVPEVRLQAQGYGETKPAQPNRAPEGRAQNRRIEFTVLEL
jgi:outer membrane protein OmpA-like peptidoglycan-associated protein